MIHIDINNNKLEALVSDEEFEARKVGWTPKETDIKSGYLLRYRELVTSATTGAVLKVPGKE